MNVRVYQSDSFGEGGTGSETRADARRVGGSPWGGATPDPAALHRPLCSFFAERPAEILDWNGSAVCLDAKCGGRRG